MSSRRESLLRQASPPKRLNSLLLHAALTEAENEKAAQIAAQTEAEQLAQTILEMIKRGVTVNKPLAESAVTVLTEANRNSATIQKILDLLASMLVPSVSKNKGGACPADSIGDAYFANRKVGCVFGTSTSPVFKLQTNGSNQGVFRGWNLVPRPTVGNRMRFDFIKEEYSKQPKKNIGNLAPKYLNKNLSNAITAIIKSQIPSKNVERAIIGAPVNKTADAIIGIVQSVTTPNTITPLKNAEGRRGFFGFFTRLLHGRPKFPTLGRFVLNATTLMPQFIDGVHVQWNKTRGYFIDKGGKIIRVFMRGNTLVSQEGHTAQSPTVTQDSKNRIAELVTKIKNLAQKANETAAAYLKAARDKASNLAQRRQDAKSAAQEEIDALKELLQLYQKLFEEGGMNNSTSNFNANSLSRYLYSSNFSKMSSTFRSKKLGELLKKYPVNSKARDLVKVRILEEIRNAGQNKDPLVAQRKIQNLRSNIKPGLSPRYNQNLYKALGIEKGRAVENLREENRYEKERYGRSYGRRSYNNERRYGRRSYNEGRGYRNEGPSGEVRRRRQQENYLQLPVNQQLAIRNAGGVTNTLNTVADVPGGPQEVIKAANALRETSGNVSKAVNIKGASPVAVQAVQRLGGANKAVSVVQGLNTLSQKTATIRRKAAQKKRKTSSRIRVAELNRVINAVKKQKLISLVAHNVTKTHNIHPNDEKRKKYYKKIIKSNILRTKFSNIVKKAAKK